MNSLRCRMISVLRPWCLLVLSAAMAPEAWPSSVDWKPLENPTRGSRYRSIRHPPLGWFAVGSLGLVKYSPDAHHWFWSQGDPSLPLGIEYRGIAHCQGRTYVVGDSGVVARTVDGRHWEHVHVGEPSRLAAIACSDSEMVAVGDGSVFRSGDGTRWETSAFGRPVAWRAVVLAPAGYLAVSRQGTLGISRDGRTWTERIDPDFLFDRLAIHGTEVVALGRRRQDSAMNQVSALTAVARSLDGGSSWSTDSSWTVPPEVGRLAGLHHDGRRWVGVTTVGTIVRSDDALRWTDDTLHMAFPFIGMGDFYNEIPVAHHDGIWLGIGKCGSGLTDFDKLETSRDLRRWECATSSVFDDHPVLVRPWRGSWWVVRSQGNHPRSPTAVQRTGDFVHWEESFLGYGFPQQLDTVGSDLVLAGPFLACRMDTSLSGTCNPTSPRRTAFASTSGGWAKAEAFGNNVDPDLVVLTRRSLPSDSFVDTLRGRQAVDALRRVGARWVVAGAGWTGWAGDSGPWHLSDLARSGRAVDLASDGKVLVLLKDIGWIWRSTDGESWQAIRMDSTASFRQVVHNGRFFAAVGDGGLLGWSRDGANWSYDTVAGSLTPNAPLISSALSGDSLVVGTAGGDLYLRVRDWEGTLARLGLRELPGKAEPRRYVDPIGRVHVPSRSRPWNGEAIFLPVR